jgi:hypothetical protein
MASAWIIRRQYSQALIAMLNRKIFPFAGLDAANLTVTDPATWPTAEETGRKQQL